MKHRIEGLTRPNFQTYFRATVNKTVWSRHKDKQIDEQNRIKSPEMNPYIHGQLVFNKGPKMPIEKQLSLQQLLLGQLDNHMQKSKNKKSI